MTIRARLRCRVAVAMIALAAGIAAGSAARAAEPAYGIDVVLPVTGTASFLGQAGQQALRLAETLVNRQGGIDGRPVRFRIHDDETSPQVAVQLASGLIAAHPPIILGSSVTAMCNAMAALMRDGPVMYCYSPGIHPEAGSYIFSATAPTDGLLATMVRYFRRRGWTRLALIVTTDATGQDGERAFDQALAAPDLRDVTLVEHIRFTPSDVSIAAQVERIKAAQPQAVIAWTTGTPMGTVLKGFIQAGIAVPLGSSTGNMSYAFMRRYAAVLPKELYFSGNQGTARGEGLRLDPRVVAAKRTYYDLFREAGLVPDTGDEVTWDATMIAVAALRHTGPDPTAGKIRDYIAHLQGFPGISGVYDFVKYPQRGLGADSPVVVRWDPAHTLFRAVSQPGGAPIAR